ncbi:uncharacterized protein LOC132275866 [Cornus florida]|uniref:uncharacterized protein LOC132275866 n=1 Tax=Cornus florida TaxID=4283 RepID=UPI00289C59F3|nr:uncharacterized protein LOC132275866 [Cornus florida]
MGASHSFISASFAHSLVLEVTQRDCLFCVDTPVGGPVSLGHLCQGCAIEIAGWTLEFDFVVFDLTGFDVILGMDCIGDWSRHKCYLASLLAEEDCSLGYVFPAVVDEFQDEFLEELMELYPFREVVFAIDVIPSSAPISMAPTMVVTRGESSRQGTKEQVAEIEFTWGPGRPRIPVRGVDANPPQAPTYEERVAQGITYGIAESL